MSETSGLPEAITLSQFGKLYRIPPGTLAKVPERLPKGCAVRFGRKWMVLVAPTREYLLSGGSL